MESIESVVCHIRNKTRANNDNLTESVEYLEKYIASIAAQTRAECAESVVEAVIPFIAARIKSGTWRKLTVGEIKDALRLAITQSPASEKVPEQRDALIEQMGKALNNIIGIAQKQHYDDLAHTFGKCVCDHGMVMELHAEKDGECEKCIMIDEAKDALAAWEATK